MGSRITLCRNDQAEIRTDEVVNHEKGRQVAIRKPLNPSLSLGGWQRLRRMYGELALALFSLSGHHLWAAWWWQRKWCPNTYALFICLNDVINDLGKTALKGPFLRDHTLLPQFNSIPGGAGDERFDSSWAGCFLPNADHNTKKELEPTNNIT